MTRYVAPSAGAVPAQQPVLLAGRRDAQPLEVLVEPDVSEYPDRVLMEVEKGSGAPLEGAPRLSLEGQAPLAEG